MSEQYPAKMGFLRDDYLTDRRKIFIKEDGMEIAVMTSV